MNVLWTPCEGHVYVYDGAVATFATEYAGVYYGSYNQLLSHEVAMDDKEVGISHEMNVMFGGVVNKTIVNGGRMVVSSGGMANHTTVTYQDYYVSEGELHISSGGTMNDTSVNSGGVLYVSTGGIANRTMVSSVGFLLVFSGGTANSVKISSSGFVYVSSGGTASNTMVNSGGSISILSDGAMTGEMIFKDGAVVSMKEGATLDFDISELMPEAGARVNNHAIIRGLPRYTLTVSVEQADGIYELAEGATKFDSTITVQSTSGERLGVLASGETLSVGKTDYTLNLNETTLLLTVKTEEPIPIPKNLVGMKDRLRWDPAGTGGYVVEYSTDHFVYNLNIAVSSTAVDTYELPAGTYQWRVKADGCEDWAVGEAIVSDNDNTPKVVQSNEDGNDDLFFANPVGTWESCYVAQHVGSINDWAGTDEYAAVYGKNKLADIIDGSTDANILLMTDDENGDTLFVDDIYTASPGNMAEQQARIAQINEIRAGAGNDVVDMTSQRFEYTGDGLTIRGGAGNDTIWANKGDNWLFGDAGNDRIVGTSGNDVIAGGIGNDRMHGGGGNDVFSFCDNWGVDNVEQLETGTVTLWFASGSIENWDEIALTYTDGENSVKVSGVAADRITLKFGDDGSDEFAALASAGAFFDATTERIFEETGKGILASL